MHDAIIVNNLSKQFSRYHVNKPVTFHEAVLQGMRRTKPVEKFWALQDVNFAIAPGRMVGLIGRNGSGKSTLLNLIGGIGKPDQGSVKVRGRMRALLDLGVGLHPDLTGRENVFINGVIAGLTRREVKRELDSIVAFAELEPFIDNPLRTYSTGMRMRLGFAIAVHTFPEILLIDEVLAVGDMAFQRKCIDRIAEFKQQGCTILFVSHNESQIKQLCDEVVYLREGKLITRGDTEVVVGQYLADMGRENHRHTPENFPALISSTGIELKVHENRFGSMEMQISRVRLLDAKGHSIQELKSGELLQIEIEYAAPCAITSPAFGVTITREDDLICYDTSTAASQYLLPTLQGRGKVTLQVERLDLNRGLYHVNVGVYEPNGTYAFDYHWHVYSLRIVPPNPHDQGVMYLPHQWKLYQNQLHTPSSQGSTA